MGDNRNIKTTFYHPVVDVIKEATRESKRTEYGEIQCIVVEIV